MIWWRFADMVMTLAIVGRPNVGKSTLFNRLVGRKTALVDDTPGLTRDRKEGKASLFDIEFKLIDTAGLEEGNAESLEGRMMRQTFRALDMADLALFLIDARAGITADDQHFAEILRKRNKPCLLLANKCEGKAGEPGYLEAYSLGLGEPVPFSGEHGLGLSELYDALRDFAGKMEAIPELEETEGEKPERPLKLAIVGRPNVGKSSLINCLLKEDRQITGPEAGLTRDAISIPWEYKGKKFELADTAGLRRKGNIDDHLEKLGVSDTINAIRFTEVAILVIDATQILEKQDIAIARLVLEEGRALVLAINKWDLMSNKDEVIKGIEDKLATSLTQARGIPWVPISAKNGRGMDKLIEAVLGIYKSWNYRISTPKLNRWLQDVTERHPPPAIAQGRRVRLRFMTQVNARPPTFVFFVNKPEELPESYNRYLANSLRETFNLPGVPLRFNMRKSKNPYHEEKG